MSTLILNNLGLSTLTQFVELANKANHDSLESYFAELINTTYTSTQHKVIPNIDEAEIYDICEKLIYYVCNNFLDLKEDPDFINSQHFKLVDLYMYLSEQDDLNIPKWDSLSRYNKIELGKKFRALTLEHSTTVKDGYHIEFNKINSSNQTLYAINKKARSLFD